MEFVVLIIFGVLAGIAIPSFIESAESAKREKNLADLHAFDPAITIYYVTKEI